MVADVDGSSADLSSCFVHADADCINADYSYVHVISICTQTQYTIHDVREDTYDVL